MKLSKAEVNHLRLLLGWMRCAEGINQSPEEQVALYRNLADHGIRPSADNETYERLKKSYDLSADVPKYIRHSLKMLTEALREHEKKMGNGAIVAGENVSSRRLPKL